MSRVSVRPADGELAHSDAPLLDDDHGPAVQRLRRGGERDVEPFGHMRARGVEQAEQDNARPRTDAPRCDLAEVEVERQDDPALSGGEREDLGIRQALEPELAKVDDVVTGVAEVLRDPSGDAHVCQEPHALARLADDNLLGREPRRVLEGLGHVLSFEVGVVRQHVLHGGAVGDLPHEHGDGNPHPADAGAAAEDLWLEGDAVETHHISIPTDALGAVRLRRMRA